MLEKTEEKLFDVAKIQDQIMHSLSAEMSVKTSLYLVFTSFMFGAAVQIVVFTKNWHGMCSRLAVELCSISAAFSLSAGITLLFAALTREYKCFPTRKTARWLKELKEYKEKNAETEESVISSASFDGMLDTLITTAENNKIENEKKARWITVAAGLLFVSITFLALGGGLALYIFLSRPL